MGIAHRPFPKQSSEVAAALDAAEAVIARTSLPYAFILEKGSVRDDGLDQPPANMPQPGDLEDLRENGEYPARITVLENLLAGVSETTAIISTTGKCGRELFTLNDREQHLYQVGSMGCASGMGLGVALNTNRPVMVLDGDGSALMKMGTFATIGAYAPGNLLHILLDNGVHDSTGGQATVSPSVDFTRVALACGYARAYSCDSLDGFTKAFQQAARMAEAKSGPVFVHMRIAPGSISPLGRPTVKPDEVARRFKAFLAGS